MTESENKMLLMDRLQKIRQIIGKYGEHNFYLAFSGGKDSTVLSALLDMACPGNTIPRVYANTGIEFRMIVDFVEREREREHSWELVMLEPSVPIKPMLEQEGYPFKSKVYSRVLDRYQRLGETKSVKAFVNNKYAGYNKKCPKILKYQFSPDFKLRVSHKCCVKMKEEICDNYAKENDKSIRITGIMKTEGGARDKGVCLAFQRSKLKAFQPLIPVTKEWEDWFIEKYDIQICDIYKEPYNFPRTGCKGCPFNINLQHDLDILQQYFPVERKQCEIIWKPVYDEYRRLGYRLRKEEGRQLTFKDYGIEE